MYCLNCGKKLPEGSKFCLDCGTPVVPVSPSESTNGKTINFGERPTFVPAMCPNCSAHMKVDSSNKIARCESCGTECLVQDAIKALNVRGNVQVGNATINVNGTNIEGLLKRIEILLADGDFNEAVVKCDTILDIEPTNSKAYIYKLMSELRVCHQDDLARCARPFDDNNNYQKAYYFGDEEERALLSGYITQINERIDNDRRMLIYTDAVSRMESADLISDFNYVIGRLKTIPGFKDSDELIVFCEKRIEEIKAENEAERLERKRKAELKSKMIKKLLLIGIPSIIAFVAFVFYFGVVIPNYRYKKAREQSHEKAMKYLESGDYEIGYSMLEKNGERDAIAKNKYERAMAFIEAGDYEQAYILLKGLNYKDSESKLDDIKPKYQRQLLSKAEVGSSVLLGTYEQDNNTSNGNEDIEWIVLAKEGKKALLLSKYGIEYSDYNTANEWLNGKFLEKSFSDVEKGIIISSTILPDETIPYSFPMSKYNANAYETGKVFLLYNLEIGKYLPQVDLRRCECTDRVKTKLPNSTAETSVWWLRNKKYVENSSGNIGIAPNNKGIIRPAMWVDLRTSESEYSKDIDDVISMINAGNYESAYALLGEHGNNDSIASIRYVRALVLIESGDYVPAYILLNGIDYKESESKFSAIRTKYQKMIISKAEVGSSISFGLYEQDNVQANGKESIEWIVLAKEKDRVLLISKYALDTAKYHEKNTKASWKSCSLRKWLNKEFYYSAFISDEQKQIIKSTIKTGKKSSKDYVTKDSIFLLSSAEVKKYMGSDLGLKKCFDTQYSANGNPERWFFWWLRPTVNKVSYVDSNGVVNDDNTDANRFASVRPAMWISIASNE